MTPPLDNPDTNSGVIRTRDMPGYREPPPPVPPTLTGWIGSLDDEPEIPAGTLIASVDEDGGVTVSKTEDQRPASPYKDFDENLAERDELIGSLGSIGEDILEGIEADESSRQGWIDNWTKGVDLLGLKIEERSATKGQKRNVSRMRDTSMLEAITKAQAQARGELLPASGPAKVQETPGAGEADDTLATDFTADFNLILTAGMPEYVPGLDRGLFSFFYSGNMFRYGYHCPFRRRPMVETYPTEDVIVSEEATDIDTAQRVTLRIPEMAPNEVKRRQHYRLWRNVDLGGTMPSTSPEQQKKQEISGVRNMGTRQKDQPYVIYQTITDLDLAMYGLKEPDSPEGLPLPYKVTTEKYSRQVLRIERYWKEGDVLFLRKRRLIHYAMVPGFAFLAYGFLHLQGNQVQALTAIIRLLVDAMMFASFPGGAKAKGTRTETNELTPGPGEWVEVGVPAGMDDLRKVLMPFPYKDLSPVSIQLYNLLQQSCARVGAAAMLEVGEGRANIPVGTIMAMLEEKTIIMSAVHKRMHDAMAHELRMIRELFIERPDAFTRVLPNPRRAWQVIQEFANLNLVPASDPNVPSQVHRIMLATALATLLSMPVAQQLLDPVDILKRVLSMIGISDPERAMRDPSQVPQQQDPVAAAAAATVQSKTIETQAKQQDSQRKAAGEAVEAQQKTQAMQQEMQDNAADRATNERIAGLKESTERMRLMAEEAREERQLEAEQAKSLANPNGIPPMGPPEPRAFGGQGL